LGGGLFIARELETSQKLLLVVFVTLGCAVGHYLGKSIDWEKVKEGLSGPKRP
jgi:hypothetical protein